MKIEITQYGHTASYEFAHEDITLDELISVLENLIKLTGYSFSGVVIKILLCTLLDVALGCLSDAVLGSAIGHQLTDLRWMPFHSDSILSCASVSA